MVQSHAATVDEWMRERAPERAPTLDHIRRLCRIELTGWEERMQWGMPGYGPAGSDNAVAFNEQKRHISFYPGVAAIERFGERLNDADCGKGCIRYSRPDRIDFDLIADMLRDIASRR
jgi:uncharacterized protein YdhG (YjbR/CyaY superfamily)